MPRKIFVEQVGKTFEFDDGTPDAEIDRLVETEILPSYSQPQQAAQPWHQQPANSISAQPSRFSKDWFKQKVYQAIDYGSNLLPDAGGLAGGIIGAGAGSAAGPGGTLAGGVGGAALGGGAGEAGRQIIRGAVFPEWGGAPQTSWEAAKRIGVEGGKQAAFEAAGQGIGRAGKAIAPKLAETAMSPGKRLLKSVPEDVNIGKTLINDAKGVGPKTITKELEAEITRLSTAQDALLETGKRQGVTVSLDAARAEVDRELAVAIKKNAPEYIAQVEALKEQLSHQFAGGGKHGGNVATTPTTKKGAGFLPSTVPGAPVPVKLPAKVDPVRARELRQGIDLLVGSWNPEAKEAIEPLRKRVYGIISGEIHSAVPGSKALDAKMTQLIPARDAAWNVSYNPSLTQSLFGRVARHTGALAGAGFGAYEGGKHGGTGGAVVGGLMGLVAPEIVASPASQMKVARILNSKAVPRTVTNVPRVANWLSKPTVEDEKKRQKRD
jgi:hypothetical protein